MMLAPIPDEFRDFRNQIKDRLYTSKVKEGESSLRQSMQGKRNSKASKIIKDIYDLHTDVVSYVKYSE